MLHDLAVRRFGPRRISDQGVSDERQTQRARFLEPASSLVLFEPLAERAPNLARRSGASPLITWHKGELKSAGGSIFLFQPIPLSPHLLAAGPTAAKSRLRASIGCSPKGNRCSEIEAGGSCGNGDFYPQC